MTNEDLKKWLESRFSKIEQRIGHLEQTISESKQPKIRIAWYRTLLGMTELGEGRDGEACRSLGHQPECNQRVLEPDGGGRYR